MRDGVGDRLGPPKAYWCIDGNNNNNNPNNLCTHLQEPLIYSGNNPDYSEFSLLESSKENQNIRIQSFKDNDNDTQIQCRGNNLAEVDNKTGNDIALLTFCPKGGGMGGCIDDH